MNALPKGDVLGIVPQWLHEGQTAVDVGAANGDVTRVMCACVGDSGTVIAIEPRPDAPCFRTDLPIPATFFTVACGSQDMDDVLYMPEIRETSSRWAAAMARPHKREIPIQVRRLDDLVERADLVKIDTQGGDVDVLLGAPRLLTTCPVWIVEAWPFGLQRAGTSLEELWKILTDAGKWPHTVTNRRIAWDEFDAWNDPGLPNRFMNWICHA